MSRHVLERREHVLGTDHRIGPLKSADCGYSHARREIRVLAVRLLEAPPPRLACDIDYGREDLTYAARARFSSSGGKHTLHQVRVPRARECNGLRKARRASRFETVQRFLVEQHGNAESRAVTNPSLYSIDEFSFAARTVAILRPFDPSNADAKPPRCGGRTKMPARVRDELFLIPQAQHLCDLLLERHAREQVGHSPIDGKSRVAIWQLLRTSRRTDERTQQDDRSPNAMHGAFPFPFPLAPPRGLCRRPPSACRAGRIAVGSSSARGRENCSATNHRRRRPRASPA